MTWGLFLDHAWRVRIAVGMGGAAVLGIESDGLISRLERNGIPRDDAEDLVAACEQGFVTASNKKGNDNGGAQDA
jgi:hypothetical protein